MHSEENKVFNFVLSNFISTVQKIKKQTDRQRQTDRQETKTKSKWLEWYTKTTEDSNE